MRRLTVSSGSSTDLEDLEGDCPVFVDREGNLVEVRTTPQHGCLGVWFLVPMEL